MLLLFITRVSSIPIYTLLNSKITLLKKKKFKKKKKKKKELGGRVKIFFMALPDS